MAAAAGIHRRDKLKARGIDDAVIGAGDGDFAGLERLAQAVEHLRLKFRQFVEEQHALMGERNLARPGMRRRRRPAPPSRPNDGARETAADRSARRPPDCPATEWIIDTSSNSRGVQRRQDRRQPLRQHRFAGARRPAHQQIMAARRRDFERALGAFLALDVAQVGQWRARRRASPGRGAPAPACP